MNNLYTMLKKVWVHDSFAGVMEGRVSTVTHDDYTGEPTAHIVLEHNGASCFCPTSRVFFTKKDAEASVKETTES